MLAQFHTPSFGEGEVGNAKMLILKSEVANIGK